MKRNPLPGTDIELSEISFGAGTAAGLMVTGERADQIAAVEKAVELGINHFDTAALYGFGASETNLGASLKAVGTDVVVTTKFHIPEEHLTSDMIGMSIRRSVHESLSRLQRGHIDILLVHNATHMKRNMCPPSNPSLAALGNVLPHISYDDLMGEGGVWETVEGLKKQGLVRYFGISGQDNDPAAVKMAIEAGRINIFNQPFNLLNASAGFPSARSGRKMPEAFVSAQADYIDFQDVLETARARGVGASVISPVAAGVLTTEAQNGESAPAVSDRAPRFPRQGQYERELELARCFRPVAERFGMGVTELAYRFALSAPGVVTVLGGFSNIKQMTQAVEAAEQGPLSDEVLTALQQIWYGVPEVAGRV